MSVGAGSIIVATAATAICVEAQHILVNEGYTAGSSSMV